MNEQLASRVRLLYDSAWGNPTRWKVDLQRAERLLREELAHQPDCIATLTSLGAVLSDRGRHEEALVVLRRAESLGSTDANTYHNLGATLVNTDENGRRAARRYFARSHSLEANPATLQAYFDPHGH